MRKLLLVIALLTLVAGCNSLQISQSITFGDDDGRFLKVEYGQDIKKHKSTYIAPTGKEMTFESELGVVMTFPDGSTYTAWQCMNAVLPGTMYMTDDKRWKLLVNGISCMLFEYDRRVDDYALVYQGTMVRTKRVGGDK